MADREKSPEEKLLIAYLRGATPVLDRFDAGPHPDSATLTAYCRAELDEETSRRIRLHLFCCDECFKLVEWLEPICEGEKYEQIVQEMAETTMLRKEIPQVVPAMEKGFQKVVAFILRQFQPLPVPPSPAAPFGVVAAEEKAAPLTWELHEEAGVSVGVALTSSKDLVVTLERTRQPVCGAIVILERLGQTGDSVICARGKTDQGGEVNLGALEQFPPPRSGEQYLVKVVLPWLPEA